MLFPTSQASSSRSSRPGEVFEKPLLVMRTRLGNSNAWLEASDA
jgi:hypothetical protein